MILLKVKYSLISESTNMLNQIAWGIILVAFWILVMILIWNIIRKPLSKLMRIKSAKVKVIHVQKREVDGYGLAQKIRKDVGSTSIAVRFLEPKRRRRKNFFINESGLNEGDKGILMYQGVYGVSFAKEGSKIGDSFDYHQRYGFEKNKVEKRKEEERKNSARKKRKYW